MVLGNNFIFVHLQKTGGSFVEQFLHSIYNDCKDIIPKHGGLYGLGLSKYPHMKFGCVRNPWAWYVSWWSSNSKHGVPYTGLFPSIFTEDNINDFGTFLRNIMSINYGSMPYIEFDDIVKFDIGVYSYRYHRCFCSPDGENLMDYIIRTERIRLELPNVLNLLNKEYNQLCEFPRKNVGGHKPYYEYYNDELIEMVRYKDRDIISNHGFEFGEDV